MNIVVGKNTHEHCLLGPMANRHGLIAGATGTGKTVTLRVLAEGFSKAGVPVFLSDIKGDLSGLAKPGEGHPKIVERAEQLGVAPLSYHGCPTVFWDVFGEKGHPVRATISELGPLMLSRLLELNPTQSAVLTIAFRIADDQGLLLLDLNDLQAALQYLGENAKEFQVTYGNISSASIGAIQRALLLLREQGADIFFGEPAIRISDFLQRTADGQGVINILSAAKLYESPRVYSTFLLWLLSELFETLPEVGDLEQPKLVFFFDEAHLLFDDTPKLLLESIEKVVRLIRSKGVGVYFVTQNPTDIPDSVLGQLGNRVQHALRAFSVRDQKAVRAAAQTFRENESLDVESAITQLGVGEALVSFLDAKGIPQPVERCLIMPSTSQMAPLSNEEISTAVRGSLLFGRYEERIDRESAYELLKKRAAQEAHEDSPVNRPSAPPSPPQQRNPRTRQGPVEAMVTGTFRSIGYQLGRQIVRGVLGSIFKSR